jgi:hypothetical protein
VLANAYGVKKQEACRSQGCANPGLEFANAFGVKRTANHPPNKSVVAQMISDWLEVTLRRADADASIPRLILLTNTF